MNESQRPWDPGSGEPVPPSTPSPQPGQPAQFSPPDATQPIQPQHAQPQHAPPQYAPPGSGPYTAPQPERRKRRIWPWILGGFAILMLGVGACGFVFYRSVIGPVDKANEFLAAVDSGDYASAASMVSTRPECFGENAERDIEQFFQGVDITDYDLSSVNVATDSGDTTGQVSGTITVVGQPSVPIEFGLVKNDDWEICGLEVDQ